MPDGLIVDVTEGVAAPFAQNLGMIGLIVVLVLIGMMGLYAFLFLKFMKYSETQHTTLVDANKEIHENQREDNRLNRQALENLTQAIHISGRINTRE